VDVDYRWFKMKSKTYNGELRGSEEAFETLELGAFATPGLLLAQGGAGRSNCGIRVKDTSMGGGHS
jgi:hypothetical protein